MTTNNTQTSLTTNSSMVRNTLTQQLLDEKKKVYRRQGLIGKGIDKTKVLINVGRNNKSVQAKIDEFNKGNIDYASVDKYIKDYKYGQRDASEFVLDSITGLSAFGAYSSSRKLATLVRPFLSEKMASQVSKFSKPLGIGLGIMTGLSTKPSLRFMDRIYLKRNEKKDNKTFWKDTLSGAIDGAIAPVAVLKGALLGVPLLIGENSIQRYLFVKRDDEKSFNDLIDKQKDNLGLKVAGYGLAAYKGRKLHSSLNRWEQAITKSMENIKDLKPLTKVDRDLSFNELAQKGMLLLDPKLMMDLFISGKSIDEKMKLLEDKNIFLPKFIQTIPENILGMFGENNIEFMGLKVGNLKDLSTIVTRFKSDCPQSRTIQEAQEFISETYGDKYTIINDKALGVGTVAETFLARDNESGKKVVLKFLKKGMSLEKIEKDRKELVDLISKDSEATGENPEFILRKINSLYDDWSKEVNLAEEMESAQILGKNAKHYNVVKSIDVKDNIYVMEMAPGVQFNQFIDQMLKEGKKISQQEMFSLMQNYFQVFFEQLLSVPKSGIKVMHADPHPGNVFINLADKKKPFTFIDTGNVLRYSPEEAIENTLNHLDYFIGNSKGIARALLRNANLPSGMTEKQSLEIVEKGLNEQVYNGHTNLLGENLFKSINDIGLKIMEENKIIPNQNNTNLLKAEITYLSNLTCLKDISKIIDRNAGSLDKVEAQEQLKIMSKEIQDSIVNSAINNKNFTMKQLKDRVDFIKDNPERFYSTILSFVNAMK
ncbi:hypothetical protein HDR58_04035 [bacterium]|nr:hypothetical protein [bacterium]